ncbi:Copper Transporter integral membrane protein that functions in [Sesbania bispinosa]|nr:Copper Transporter integral membrane protein that functions in [Sesbania bispinosa]
MSEVEAPVRETKISLRQQTELEHHPGALLGTYQYQWKEALVATPLEDRNCCRES